MTPRPLYDRLSFKEKLGIYSSLIAMAFTLGGIIAWASRLQTRVDGIDAKGTYIQNRVDYLIDTVIKKGDR